LTVPGFCARLTSLLRRPFRLEVPDEVGALVIVDDELGRVSRRVQERNFRRPQDDVVHVRPLPAETGRAAVLTVTRMTGEGRPGMISVFAKICLSSTLLNFVLPSLTLLTNKLEHCLVRYL